MRFSRYASKVVIKLAGALFVLACLIDCGSEVAGPVPKPDPNNAKSDSAKADADRARKELAHLAASMPRLPIPMGTRYFYAPAPAPAPKVASAQACREERDIFAIPANPRRILGIDTVTYLDSLGVAHCLHQEPTIREDHARYLFDPDGGEAWERIQIKITPDDLLPRLGSLGTGRIRLTSGLELDILADEWDMAMDNSTGTPVIQDAHLRLATPDGRILQLDLVKPHPFRALDFFPSWENPPPGTPIMAGPVLRGTDTVGRVNLYADRSLAFLDPAGNPVTPE